MLNSDTKRDYQISQIEIQWISFWRENPHFMIKRETKMYFYSNGHHYYCIYSTFTNIYIVYVDWRSKKGWFTFHVTNVSVPILLFILTFRKQYLGSFSQFTEDCRKLQAGTGKGRKTSILNYPSRYLCLKTPLLPPQTLSGNVERAKSSWNQYYEYSLAELCLASDPFFSTEQ